MGEIAEAMSNGLFCACCGVMLDGEEPGYPRYCTRQCEPPGHRDPIKPTKQRTEAQRNKRRERNRRYRARKAARAEAARAVPRAVDDEIDALEEEE